MFCSPELKTVGKFLVFRMEPFLFLFIFIFFDRKCIFGDKYLFIHICVRVHCHSFRVRAYSFMRRREKENIFEANIFEMSRNAFFLGAHLCTLCVCVCAISNGRLFLAIEAKENKQTEN